MQLGAAGLEVPVSQPVNPLWTDLTLYVDSATGSDSNPGTQTQPLQTLARAWQLRNFYADIGATLRIQLIGAGPYALPPMGFSACTAEGNLTICGDSAAETVVATGTATGDMSTSTMVLPTSATGGVNNLRDEFLRMTSGNCAGCVFQINENAANSITVSQVRGRSQNGAIANGDTWQVIRPGTEIRITNSQLFAAANPNTIVNFTGSSIGTASSTPRHWFYNVRFTTTDASQLKVIGAQVGFVQCRAESGVFIFESQVVCGTAVRSSMFGIASANLALLWGAGLVVSGGVFIATNGARVVGVLTMAGSSNSLLGGYLTWGGGRLGAALSMTVGAQLSSIGSGQDTLLNATVTATGAGTASRLSGNAPVRCAVTSGSCFRAQLGGFVGASSAAPTGGTTDPAGFGYDARGGGTIWFQNVQPALTGGTAGQDLRTTNQVAANAALAANGTAVGDAADALLGEVLARVA